MPAVWAGAVSTVAGGLLSKKKAPAPLPDSGFRDSPFTIDSSGWVVNFRGIASSSGSRDFEGGAGSGIDSALTSDVQTPLGSIPAWTIAAVVALVAIVAVKKRKAK